MPFITRQYLVDRLKTYNLKVAFEDDTYFHTIYVRHQDFEIEYIVRDTGYFYIDNVVFNKEKDYQLLFEYEKKLEPMISEYVELNEYLKVNRK